MTCIDFAARIEGAFRILFDERDPAGVEKGGATTAGRALRFREGGRISTSGELGGSATWSALRVPSMSNSVSLRILMLRSVVEKLCRLQKCVSAKATVGECETDLRSRQVVQIAGIVLYFPESKSSKSS